MSNPVLVEILRGEQVESAHRGAVVVCDAAGKSLLEIGDVSLLSPGSQPCATSGNAW